MVRRLSGAGASEEEAEDRMILVHYNWWQRLKKRNKVDRLLCHRCGKEIEPGDRIHCVNHSPWDKPSPIEDLLHGLLELIVH